jgi:hypothetical protein
VFYIFYAEIMATRKGDLIDVLNTTDAYDDDDMMMMGGPVTLLQEI